MKNRVFKLIITAGILFISAVIVILNYMYRDSGDFYEKEYTPCQYTQEDYRILGEQEKLDVDTKNIHLDMIVYQNLEEIEKNSDIILIGSPKTHLMEGKFVENSFFNKERGINVMTNWYTVSPLEIKSVFKGQDVLDSFGKSQFNIIQPFVGVYVDEKGSKSMMSILGDDFLPLKKGSEYILFLEFRNGDSDYPILIGTQGIVNIDGRDKELAAAIYKGRDLDKRGEKSLSENIREDALKKYQKEIEELGIPIVWEVKLSEEDLTDAIIMEPVDPILEESIINEKS